jgi:hypothetical protein
MAELPAVAPAQIYPCPVCGTSANLTTGCPGCGRAPDPDAAEVVALDQEIGFLNVRLDEARQVYTSLGAQVQGLRLRREQLATRVRTAALARWGPARDAARGAGAARAGEVAGAGSGGAGAGSGGAGNGQRAEASTRTVQNVLFILGGLLLGTAAVVFTAIAWATYGITGRALILAVVTAVALAIPPLALWRGLRATAETFAQLGLLLVVLDGYAAWFVNLFGVKEQLPATRYAGLVAAATAVVALVYRGATRLVGPAFAALAASQPVLPLLAAATTPDGPVWALLFAGVAALNLGLLLWWWRRPGGGVGVALRACSGVLYGVALAAALVVALRLQELQLDPAEAAVTGEALVFVGVLIAAGAALTRVPRLHSGAGCVLVLLVALAAGRLAAALWPTYTLVSTAVVVAALALVVVAPVGGSSLGAARAGARIGGFVAAGVAALGLVGPVLTAAAHTIAAAQPTWRADLDRVPYVESTLDWRPVVAIVLLTGAFAVLLRREAVSVLAVGTATLALALPATLPLLWWVPSAVDIVLACGLAAGAVLARRPGGATVRAALAAALAGQATLAGLARPSSTAAVLATVVVAGAALAGLSRPRRPGQPAHRTAFGGLCLLAAFLALPWCLDAGLAANRVDPHWRARLAVVATVVLLAALVAVRQQWTKLFWYAYPGALAAALLVPAWSVVVVDAEPTVVYAGISVLALATALWLAPRREPAAATVTATAAVLPGAVLVVRTADAVLAVLLAPYTWLGRIWSGVPTGAGLAPDSLARGPSRGAEVLAIEPADAIGLGLLGLALVVTAFAWWRTIRAAASAATLALPVPLVVAVAAFDPQWPVVATLSLGLGLALLLIAGIGLRDRLLAAGATVPGLALALAGLAGELATVGSTLAALAVTVLASAAIGGAARTPAFRTTGWVATAATTVTTATAAFLAADLSLRVAAFGVLAVAATLLGGATVLRARRPAEGVALEASAHAAAAVALVFTVGSLRHAAAVFTLWGVVVGARALWPASGRTARGAYASAAAACELIAWWLLLADRQVALLEAYTLPLAAVALLAGWVSWRARPQVGSWIAYGPALFAAFLPSLATIAATEGEPARRLLLGAGALAVLVAGAVRRLQAPVVVGGAVLSLVALHELVLVWDLVPRWIPLALGGLLLVGIAMTYERRRRDLARLRGAVARMT